jgi:O-antigen/teichoic acid export membrane protein
MLNIRKRLLSGSAWALFFKMASALFGLAVYALLARLLTQSDFGVYLLTLSVVTFVSILVQTGMSKSAVRLVAESLAVEDTERAVHSVRTTLRVVFLAGIAVGGLWLLFASDLVAIDVMDSPEMAQLGWLTAGWFILFALQKHFAEIFRGSHDIRLASLFEGPMTSFLLVLFFGISLLMRDSITLAMALQLVVLAMLVGTLVAAFLVHRRYTLFGRSARMPTADLWPIAWPILLTNLLVFVANQADLWIMGIFMPKEEVAVYGAALRTVMLIAIPLQIVNSVVQPMIVELYRKGELPRLERMLGVTAAISALPAVLVLLLIVFGGDRLLGLVFGEAYVEGATVLIILCLGRTVSVLAGSCGQCMMMGGLQRLMLVTTLINGAVSIVAALLLVEPYGSIGVASAFAVGTTLQNLWQALLVRKHMGLSTFARFDRLLPGGA